MNNTGKIKGLNDEVKMTKHKLTLEPNNKNEINDSKYDVLSNDNTTVSINYNLSKKEESNFTSLEASTKVNESDSDDEPIIKKFEKELSELSKRENRANCVNLKKGNSKNVDEEEKERENEAPKEKPGQEKIRKLQDDNDDKLSNAAIGNQEDDSDDECILNLIKKEIEEKKLKKTNDDKSKVSSPKSSLLKKKNSLKKTPFKLPANNNNTISSVRSTFNDLIDAPLIPVKNVNDRHITEIAKYNVTNTIINSNAHANKNVNSPNNKSDKIATQKTIKKSPPKSKTTRTDANTNRRSSATNKKETAKKNSRTKKCNEGKIKPKAEKKTNTKKQKKSNGSGKSRRKSVAANKSKTKRHENPENDSIVMGSFDPHNRTKKEKLVAQLLIRWWYVLPDWPPADYNYEEELKKRKLKLVPLEEYEDEEDIDKNGFRKVYEISAFPGIFRDALGNAYDLRDKETCPCFNNLIKKSDHELLELICQAIKNQIECLKNSVYDESVNEKRLEKELKDVEAKLSKILKKGTDKEYNKHNNINNDNHNKNISIEKENDGNMQEVTQV